MAQDSTLKFLVAAQVTGQEQIARLINDTDRLNKTTKGLQTAFSQMGGAAKSLSEVQKNAAAIDAARAEKLARLSQEFYNSALSIDRTAKSARDSASAFEEAFQAQEMVAKAQRDAAAAAAVLRAKLDPMIPIQNRFNAEMDHAADLLRMGAISQKEYAAATTMARQNLYSAQQALHGMNAAQTGVIINGVRYNSMADAQAKALRQQRQGAQMLGMQFNDLATSISTGASPITAFNQQIGQVGIAMAEMGGKMGAVGQFLIGPWGTALTIATMALGFLAEKFLFTGDSAEDAKSKIADLGEQFSFAAMTGADLDRINQLLAESNKKIAQTSIQAANATAQKANADARAADEALNAAKAELIKQRAILNTMRIGNEQTGGSAADVLGAQVAPVMQNRAVKQLESDTDRLAKIVDGFNVRARRATAESYSLSSAMDAGSRASEAHQARINDLSNSYADGKITLQQFRTEVDKANASYAAFQRQQKQSKGTKKAKDEILTFEKAFKDMADQNKAKKFEFPLAEKFYEDAQKISQKALPDWQQAMQSLTDSFRNGKGEFADIADATATYQNGLRDIAAGPIQDAIKAQQDLIDKANGAQVPLQALRQQFVDMAYAEGNSTRVTMELLEMIDQFDRKVAETKIAERNEEIRKSYESIGMAVNDAFKGMLSAGMSWKDGMKGIINSVIDELWRLYVVQQIVGFVTKAIGGVSAGEAARLSGDVASTIAANPSLFANGTVNAPGGMAIVGERGPELVNLPRGSQVIPAHRAQNMMGGGVTVNVDARGSADPAAVRAQVQAGIMQAAPAIIAAAQQRTVSGLRRPRLGGVMQ